MRQYSKILVIIEPKRDQQLALQRAIEMARFNPHVHITALRLIYDFSSDVHLISKKQEIGTRADVEKTHQEDLDKEIAKTKALYNDVDFSQVTIDPKLLWVRDISEGMIHETNNGHYDLIIKAANNHGIFDSIIFTPHDWNLLRHSTIPVIIAKEHDWDKDSTIVVAVDFMTTDKQAMNILLLREAQLLATITKSKIHLVNSAPVVLPTVMLEVPNYAPELYADSVLAEHKKRITQFAEKHNIPIENCHIVEGMPDEVIPRICKKLNTKTIFIGSIGRSGVRAALIGNTCEEIVDYVDADLFVLNTKTLEKDQEVAHSQE